MQDLVKLLGDSINLQADLTIAGVNYLIQEINNGSAL